MGPLAHVTEPLVTSFFYKVNKIMFPLRKMTPSRVNKADKVASSGQACVVLLRFSDLPLTCHMQFENTKMVTAKSLSSTSLNHGRWPSVRVQLLHTVYSRGSR